jgi:hypothetical protein
MVMVLGAIGSAWLPACMGPLLLKHVLEAAVVVAVERFYGLREVGIGIGITAPSSQCQCDSPPPEILFVADIR